MTIFHSWWLNTNLVKSVYLTEIDVNCLWLVEQYLEEQNLLANITFNYITVIQLIISG